MKLCDEIVYHKSLGKGYIVKHIDDIVFVSFENDQSIRKFKYPSAFGTYIKLDNQKLLKEVQKDKDKNELEKDAKEKVEREKFIEKHQEKKKTKEKNNEGKNKTLKNKDMCNIAFKCTYCDGGKDKTNIGFYGLCSDATIRYNINVAKHVWCSNENSYCNSYLDGEITRRELASFVKKDDFVCYEGKMLRDWEASAGYHHNGKNKDKPMTIRNTSSNNLALLTTRFPYEQEKDRIIFAIFLILENYEGDSMEEGHVKANPNYRIQLSIEESKELKFWDFYYNRNKPEIIKLGSGLHRYISDIQSAQVIKKICEIKKGTSEEKSAHNFLEKYCSLKQLDINKIPEPNGALRNISN